MLYGNVAKIIGGKNKKRITLPRQLKEDVCPSGDQQTSNRVDVYTTKMQLKGCIFTFVDKLYG